MKGLEEGRKKGKRGKEGRKEEECNIKKESMESKRTIRRFRG